MKKAGDPRAMLAVINGRIEAIERYLKTLKVERRRLINRVTLMNPAFRAKLSELAFERYLDPENRKRHSEACKRAWQDPEKRARRAKQMIEINKRPEVKAKRRKSGKLRWKQENLERVLYEARMRKKSNVGQST